MDFCFVILTLATGPARSEQGVASGGRGEPATLSPRFAAVRSASERKAGGRRPEEPGAPALGVTTAVGSRKPGRAPSLWAVRPETGAASCRVRFGSRKGGMV